MALLMGILTCYLLNLKGKMKNGMVKKLTSDILQFKKKVISINIYIVSHTK